MRLMKLVLVAALTAAPAMTFAQTNAPKQPNNPIVKREFNQQKRIGNGIRNGRLTPRQGARHTGGAGRALPRPLSGGRSARAVRGRPAWSPR